MKIRKVHEEDSWADLEAKAEKEELEAEEYISKNLKGSKLMNFDNLQDEYIKTKKEILKLVDEYIEIRNNQDPDDHDYWLGQYGFGRNDIEHVRLVNYKKWGICLVLKTRFGDEDHVMRSVDFLEFLKYIEDADAYKNSKKFNI